MNPALRHQLTALDRALIRLLDERARLAREAVAQGAAGPPQAALEDLLARSSGEFPARRLREVLAAVDAGCRESAGGGPR